MKVLLRIDNDPPHASGGGYYALFRFAQKLAQRGHQVQIWASKDLGWVKPESNLHLRFRPTISRKSRLGRKADRVLCALHDRLVLKPFAKKWRPDWICGVLTHSAIRAVELGRDLGVPVANFIYECPPWLREVFGEEAYQRENQGYTSRLWEQTRLAYLGSRVLFPNSELSREWNGRWLGRDVAIPIHPGIDLQEMPVELDAPRKPGPMRILYVGRLAAAKNVQLVAKAFAALDRPAELHIVGEGPERAVIEPMLLGKAAVLHGFVEDEVLWNLFRECDLLVFPSRFEGFGMPPMQALHFGKPAVVSDIAVFRSIYEDRVEYVPVDDPSALVEMLREFADHPEPFREKARRGRDWVDRELTWDRAAERIEQVLEAAADKKC